MGRLLTVWRVAKHYDVLPETVRNWWKAGKIKAVRIGLGPLMVDSDSLPNWPKEKPDPPVWMDVEDCVYFAQKRDGGPIKIGYTGLKVRERLVQIEQGIPERCELIALLAMKGPKRLEKHLHEMFEGIQLKGEWFLATKELLDFIVKHGGDRGLLMAEEATLP